MKVLGIETSCDEAGIALYDSRRGLLAHTLRSQTEIHAEYGGVVPELASRDHIRHLVPLTRRTLAEAGVGLDGVDGVAFTAGPGLVGALLVGAAFGRSLAWALNVPAIGVHHMEGHLLAPLLDGGGPDFPFLALLVSGGHTLLVKVGGIGAYQVLGETQDDAAGEAFDKTAKLLGLGYPGGPALAQLAAQGNPSRFRFPRPMTNRPGLDFSFSGLKTFAVNTLRDHGDDPQTRADIACAFQKAVVETLTVKCRRAVRQTGLGALVVAGGVGANLALRQRLREFAAEEGIAVHYPPLQFCTDNGAMIAYAGCRRLECGLSEPLVIDARVRWPMAELSPP